MSPRICLCLASVLGFLAVVFGAFGAHGLKDSGYLKKKYADTEPKNIAGLSVPASYKYLQDFETGVEYHMSHALALAISGLLMFRRPSAFLSIAAWCFLLGILLFSGALYILVIGGPRWLGFPWALLVPVGGTLYLLGWLALFAGACKVTFRTDSLLAR